MERIHVMCGGPESDDDYEAVATFEREPEYDDGDGVGWRVVFEQRVTISGGLMVDGDPTGSMVIYPDRFEYEGDDLSMNPMIRRGLSTEAMIDLCWQREVEVYENWAER